MKLAAILYSVYVLACAIMLAGVAAEVRDMRVIRADVAPTHWPPPPGEPWQPPRRYARLLAPVEVTAELE